MIKTHIIVAYEEYVESNNLPKLSKSTLLRILKACKSNQQHSLEGLDSYVADGIEGFETLKNLVNKLFIELNQEINVTKVNLNLKIFMKTLSQNSDFQLNQDLEKSKIYLKSRYQTHVFEETSTIPSHCRILALSDYKDPKFGQNCDHEHVDACQDCIHLVSKILQ